MLIGQTLAHYRITAAIGAGGMGEVYRATDTKLGREVAIKLLPAELANDPERLARFEREAKLLASLNHPNIAHVYGFESVTQGDGPTAHFLAMELVAGEDLSERLKRGPMRVDDALGVARQIAEALEEAHERGIVHRDLKPGNVKVAPDGKVKVLDFGLAKAYAGEAASGSTGELSQSPTLAHTGTAAGIILGTAAYMSPEQARGRPVDKRADVWAFGAVLYEMVTGKRLFEGETVSDVLAAVLTREPEWTRLPAATPRPIRDLLRRCLRREVKARQQSMGDARIAVEEALAGASAADDAASSRTRPVWRRALPWVATLAAGALISGVVLWGLGLRRPQRDAMHFRAVTNFAGVQAQPGLSPDGRSVAFVSNRDGDYDIYVGLVSGGTLIQITHDPNLEARPSWSPDGASITYSRLNDWGLWDIWQVPALGGTPRRLILNAADPAWSRDGRSLAYVNDLTRTIWVSDPAGQSARQVTTPGSSEYPVEPRFSPDGRELAFVTRGGGPRGELNVIDLGSGEIRRLTRDAALAQCPAWSPDGRHLYFASSRGGAMNIWKIGARGGEAEPVTAGQGDDVQPDVSADGSRIVFATYRERLGFARLDLAARPGPDNPRQLSIDLARNQIGPAYSPDGAHLAYFSNFKGVEREGIWMAGADGSDPTPLVRDARVNIFPKWSPDGNHLIYMSYDGGGTEYRRVAISGGTPQTLLANAAWDWNFDVGPDGRLLFRDEDGRVQSYDPSSQKTRELAVSPQSKDGWLLRFSPDGQSVAYVLSAGAENDPLAGLWVEDFKSPPRQVFHGWVTSYARGPGDEIFFLEAKADLQGVLWKVGWDGHGLARVATNRLVNSYSAARELGQNYLDVSPDGRYVVFGSQEVQQANVGMIENVR
jgi:Tol biopolymer transport system component